MSITFTKVIDNTQALFIFRFFTNFHIAYFKTVAIIYEEKRNLIKYI